jgi:Predicted transcriptional regulators
MPTLGEQLKKARKTANLTQRQLADKINAKHNSISNWENDQNRPDPDTIEIICGVLKISPSYLLGFDESKIHIDELKEQVEALKGIKVDKSVIRLLEYYKRLSSNNKDILINIAETLGKKEEKGD